MRKTGKDIIVSLLVYVTGLVLSYLMAGLGTIAFVVTLCIYIVFVPATVAASQYGVSDLIRRGVFIFQAKIITLVVAANVVLGYIAKLLLSKNYELGSDEALGPTIGTVGLFVLVNLIAGAAISYVAFHMTRSSVTKKAKTRRSKGPAGRAVDGG